MEFIIFLAVCAVVILALSMLFSNVPLPFFNEYRDTTLDECGYFSKRQWVRLLDIFVLGPAGVYIGYKIYTGQHINPMLGLFTIMYGLGTIAYNGKNYQRNSAIKN